MFTEMFQASPHLREGEFLEKGVLPLGKTHGYT